MATKPKAILSTHDGREASPITKASNVLFENGQTAQDILNDRQDAMISPVIENSSSMFKVGQGDNVDYSSNVVNGAYESMVLKGKSMVNCIQEPSSQDVVLPYEFEDGQYVTINDTKESGALGVELKGQTLVNTLVYEHTALLAGAERNGNTFTLDKSQQWSRVHLLPSNSLWIPNETYTTILYDVVGDTSTLHMCSQNGGVATKTPFTNNKAVFTMGRGRDTDNDYRLGYIESTTIVENETVSFKAIILKGDYSDVDVPYFTGMASCKMPILHTVGKNLLYKHNDVGNTYGISQFHDGGFTTGEMGSYGAFGCIRSLNNPTQTQLDKNPTSVQKGKTYTISCEVKKMSGTSAKLNYLKFTGYNNAGDNYSWTNIGWNSAELNYDYNNTVKLSKTIECDCSYKHIVFAGQVSGDSSSAVYKITNIQLEESSSSTTYEDHKSSILSLPEEVVLRNIGSVKDTLNLNTGDYIQRIGEVVLDGSEDEKWTLHQISSYTTHTRFEFGLRSNNKPLGIVNTELKCDRFTWINGDVETEHIKIDGGDARSIFIYIQNSKLATQDVNGLRVWLSQNPTTIQYELETPIVTKINLSSTLKSWNTTTHIYSEIPENTLYPILSHSNPTYPVILKPSTKYSIVANSYSNDHTNSAINFNLGGATASTTVGNRVTTITTPSTLSNKLLTMSGRGNKLNNVMVIEGDVVGDEPYFEGVCDCKSPILSNVGKNLFDKTKVKREKYQNYNLANGTFSISSNPNYKVTDYIRVKPNTSYTSRNLGDGAYYTFNKKPITDIICRAANFTVPSNAHYVVLNMHIGQDEDTVGLQEVPSSSLHESYKSNITTFDQKDGKTIVLRSLPNGVCDTLNVETGEYVQRIEEIVWDKTINASVNSPYSTENHLCFDIYNVPRGKIYEQSSATGIIANSLIPRTWLSFYNTKNDEEGIVLNRDSGNTLVIKIAKSKLTSLNLEGLRTYLSQNPITVQYELATPIVKTINLSGYPFSYENGHVILSSGSIEQSLTPKVEYSVATNRNGQIRSNQKMVERHQKQLDQLQAIILANLVNSQYNQTLTTLKYELSRV